MVEKKEKKIKKQTEITEKYKSELEAKKIEYIEKNTSFLKEIRNATQILVLEEAGFRPDKTNEVLGITEQRRKEYLLKAHEIYPHFKDLDLFKSAREQILSALENKILEKINEELNQDRTNSRDLAYLYSVLHGANRLERNVSTENVQVNTSFIKVDLDKIRKE